LSSEIGNFETDFSNGYLVGEILHRFNQQKNFHKFIDKHSADAKINNWCLLSPTINALAVKFDSKCAYAIMCQQKGYASKILYQIKMAIDKLSKTAPVATRPKDNAVPLCNMPMRPQKPMYDQQGQKFFEKSIRMLVENPNDVMLARTQERFVNEKMRQDQQGAQMQRDEEDFMLMNKEQMRQMRLQQTRREHDFLQDWQAKGAEDWAVNQAIANEREAKKMRAQQKIEQDKYDRQANALTGASSQMRDGIDDFEMRLRAQQAKKSSAAPLPPARRSRLGDGPETTEELTDRLQNSLADAKTMQIEAQQFLGKVRGKQLESSELQNARSRRRRQFIAEQRASQADSEDKRLMSLIQQDLLKGSCIEEQLGVDLWKINQYKSIIVENRNYREVQYAERRAQDHAEALERDSAACQTMVQEHQEEVGLQQERYSEVLQAKEVSSHERAKQACSEVLDDCVNLALSMAEYREVTCLTPEEFPVIKWEEMKRLFIAGTGQARFSSSPDLPEAPVPASAAPLEDRLGVMNKAQLDDYLNNKGLWSPDTILGLEDACAAVVIERPKKAETEEDDGGKKGKKDKKGGKGKGKKEEEAPADEEGAVEDAGPTREEREAAILPEAHYDMGDLIQKVRVQATPLDKPQPPPDVPQCPMCICLYGQEYVGKSLQARRLAEKWGLGVIEVDELLRKAMEAASNEPSGGYPIAEPQEEEGAFSQYLDQDADAADADAEADADAGADADADADADAAAAEADGEGEAAEEVPLDIVEEEEKPEDPNIALAAFASLGHKCRKMLVSGGSVDDSLYAQLVALEVKHGLGNGQKDKGWVLADFPETADQAKELEKSLSGYDQDVHIPAPEDRSSYIMPPTPLPPKDPDVKLVSGIHLVFQMEGEKEELLHRALGRRVDPETDAKYHLLSNPPPEDEVCKERLQPVEVSDVTPTDAMKNMVDLSARLAVHDYGTKELEDWIGQFGTLRRVDTLGLSADEVFDRLDATVQELQNGRDAEGEVAAAKVAAQKEEHAAADAEKAGVVAAATEAVEAAKAAMEEAKAVVAEAEEAVGAAPKGAEKKAAEAELQGKNELLEAAEAEVTAQEAVVTAIEDADVAAEKARLEALRPEPRVPDELAVILGNQWDSAEEMFKVGMMDMMSKISFEREDMVEHFRAATQKFAVFIRRPDNKQEVIQKFQDSFNSVSKDMRFDDRTMEELHRRVDEVAVSLWELTEEREEQALVELEAIKGEGWVEDHSTALERMFTHMLQLEVDAAHNLKTVVVTHAAAIKNGGVHPDPKSADEEEEEGGTSCPDLPTVVAELYLSAEEKEAAAAAADGGGKKGKKGKGGGEEEETDPNDPYPSLTKTYMNALKLAGAAGVAEIVAMGGAAPEEDGGGGKAKGKDKGKKGKKGDEEEVPEELSDDDKVLQQRIATQDEILVRRLRRLRKYGTATLDELQIFAQTVYQRFASSVDERVKAEATCISALSQVARGTIEEKDVLPFHLTVDHADLYRFPLLLQLPQDTDLTLDKGVRLIPVPAAPPVPVVESVDETSFSPDQMEALKEQLKGLAASGGAGARRGDIMMTRTRFADAIHRLAQDDWAMPEQWQALTKQDFAKLAQVFDTEGKGCVDGAEFLTAVGTDAAGVLAKCAS